MSPKKSAKTNPPHPLCLVKPFDEKGRLQAIIDTPKGSRNKYKFEEKRGLFVLSGILPVGSLFPFDFGYIPGTKGGDGDPLDVLVLMDEPVFVGCLVPARLIGLIEAEQIEHGKTERNDRFIAVADKSRNHREVRDLADLPENLVHEIEHFFISYNAVKGKQFKPCGRRGARKAAAVIKSALSSRRRKSALSRRDEEA